MPFLLQIPFLTKAIFRVSFSFSFMFFTSTNPRGFSQLSSVTRPSGDAPKNPWLLETVGDFLRPRTLVHFTIKRTVYFSNTNGSLQSRSNNLIQSCSTIRDRRRTHTQSYVFSTTRDSNFPVFTCTVIFRAHNIVMHLN